MSLKNKISYVNDRDEEIYSKESFELPQHITFYSSVISHSYYSIFYAAKALLLKKGLKTESPNVHTKTYFIFKKDISWSL